MYKIAAANRVRKRTSSVDLPSSYQRSTIDKISTLISGGYFIVPLLTKSAIVSPNFWGILYRTAAYKIRYRTDAVNFSPCNKGTGSREIGQVSAALRKAV